MCGRGTYKQLFLSLNDQPTIGPIKKKDNNNKKTKNKNKTGFIHFKALFVIQDSKDKANILQCNMKCNVIPKS